MMSHVSRRGFLGAMLGAIAVAAVPTLASTTNRYQHALSLYDAAVADRNVPKLCNQRFDALLTYLMSEFPFTNNAQTIDEMAKVIRTTGGEHGWRDIPPSVSDMVYPVALTKMALTQDRLPLDPSMLTQFDLFHKTYGRAIIAASDQNWNKKVA